MMRRKLIFFWEPHLRQVFDLEQLLQRKQLRVQTAHLLLAHLRRRRVLRTIHATFKKGVHGGFRQMKPSAKNAVLSNLHTKLYIPMARREYHHTQRSVHFERLFYTLPDLFTTARAHMCGQHMSLHA